MGRVSHDSIAHRLDREERATFDVRRCDSSLSGKQILMRRVLHDSIAHRLERVERVTFDGDILFICEGSTSKVSGATPPCSIARIPTFTNRIVGKNYIDVISLHISTVFLYIKDRNMVKILTMFLMDSHQS